MIDYSCYIVIQNNTTFNMQFKDGFVSAGSYISSPAVLIDPGGYTNFQITGNNATGAGGNCTYTIWDTLTNETVDISFSYSCPVVSYISTNDVTALLQGNAQSGIVLQILPNPFPQVGQPLSAQFIVSNSKLV